jgi:hypothetical protein
MKPYGGATRAKVKGKAKDHYGRTITPLRITKEDTKGEREKENKTTLDPVNPSLPAIAVTAA